MCLLCLPAKCTALTTGKFPGFMQTHEHKHCRHIIVVLTGRWWSREGHRSIQKLHLPRLHEILSTSTARAACNADTTCTHTHAASDAQPSTSATTAAKETASITPEVVALCQQLKQLQEAAVAVCELLVTQQNILETSMGGAGQDTADTQV